MAKADLHVHSRYSNHPSEWFLQRIGASESYTDPEFIYRTAKEQGMQFVTITDHNSIEGALRLKERYPEDCFVSMETTAYFPEDRCKIHVLVYGITETDYHEIQKLRTNIYELRDFIRAGNIACSVAHATYSINDKLTAEHLEKLILLFDVFEGLNGARSRLNNRPWKHILSSLTPAHIERLADRYGIEPFSANSWIKGYTGGSDDHAGLFMGKTYTTAEAANIDEFLAGIRNRRSVCEGRYSDYQSLAFTIYKIAYDFSKSKSGKLSQTLLSQISESVFGSNGLSLKNRFKLKTIKTLRSKTNGNNLHERYWDLLQDLANGQKTSIEERLDGFYDKLAVISDEFFKILLASLENDLRHGDILNVTRNISSSLPGIFLTIPFFSTLKHLHQGKHTAELLAARLNIRTESPSKRILWFTDTLSYMNGVSMTVKKIGWLSYLKGKNLTIVTSIPEEEMPEDMPPNVINLPNFFEFRLPHYEHYQLRVPCLLMSIKQLYQYEPDEIYISTPGPVGLFGLLASKLLNTKSIGVFHTDFTLQAHELIEDGALDSLVESYLKLFHSLADENHVPTEEYINLLDGRGYDRAKMKVFRRGIDSFQFAPRATGRAYLRNTLKLSDGPTLLFAGRISRDKNIHFLFDVYDKIAQRIPSVNLIVAGDGPDLPELKKKYEKYQRIVFTGRLGHDVLPEVYSGADLFVFPSTTDTFGMVVLEAQSCGLPAVVSDRGGPKEIIQEGRTGSVAHDADVQDWEEKILSLLRKMEICPEEYLKMREESRINAVTRFDWNVVISEITSDSSLFETMAEKNGGGKKREVV
ncbi:MAG: glycosyltransferase [Candidatus Latescibacterota bacterium]